MDEKGVEVTFPDGTKRRPRRLDELPTPGPETVRQLLGLLYGRDSGQPRNVLFDVEKEALKECAEQAEARTQEGEERTEDRHTDGT